MIHSHIPKVQEIRCLQINYMTVNTVVAYSESAPEDHIKSFYFDAAAKKLVMLARHGKKERTSAL